MSRPPIIRGMASFLLLTTSSIANLPSHALNFAAALERARPTVVLVEVFLEFHGPAMTYTPANPQFGSGVVVNAGKGHIVTNAHVLTPDLQSVLPTVTWNRASIKLTSLDGRSFPARVVGTDIDTDIALLQIHPMPDGLKLKEIEIAESQPRVGDFVAAIGSPSKLVLDGTATFGVVSFLGRRLRTPEWGFDQYYIQTDAAINNGNSGGALVNDAGALVGINVSRVKDNVGLNFAIPAKVVRWITSQIAEHGEVRRGQLGIVTADVSDQALQVLGLETREGALVQRVVVGTAADRAGIGPGDVVVAFNGERVVDRLDLSSRLRLTPIGDQIALEVVRQNERKVVKATMGVAREDPQVGIEWQNFSEGDLQGVKIETVPREGPASNAGLERGDVVVSVNGKQVKNIYELEQQLADVDGVALVLRRRVGNVDHRVFIPLVDLRQAIGE